MVAVVLTPTERMQAAIVGVLRQLAALKGDLPDRHGYDGEDGWTAHIEGAAGELAVARALDRYWQASVNTFKRGGDVGRLQVRTRSRPDYDLLVRPVDPDRAIFVHVTGRVPIFEVHGWLTGAEAKRPEWLQDHGGRPPAYFVPTAHLHPLAELPREAP